MMATEDSSKGTTENIGDREKAGVGDVELKREERRLRRRVRAFRAGDRLPRDEAHRREPG
jgi:hypothetical protein